MRHSRVVAAVIRRGDRYLCMRRCRSKYSYISEKWEFPGGKTEAGETDEAAVVREIAEEMDWNVGVVCHLGTVCHAYPDFTVTLAAYLCDCGEEDDFRLLEHLEYEWLTKDKLNLLDWTEADRVLIADIMDRL